jgi:DNA polymerase-1
MYLLLAAHPDGAAIQELTAAGLPHPANPEPRIVRLTPTGAHREARPPAAPQTAPPTAPGNGTGLAAVVRELEKRRPRWIWHRTQDWYPSLLAAGVDVERCYDLSLCGAILAHSEFTAHTPYAKNAEKLTQDDELQPPRMLQPPPPPADQGALFDDPGTATQPRQTLAELRAEYAVQQEALAAAAGPAAAGADAAGNGNRKQRLQLLLAAESASALVAAEMQHAGVPWREELHEHILAEHLGPRPPLGHRPAKLEALNTELRGLLNAPSLNPDSPQELMRALHRNGIEVKSTRQWELKGSSHPAIAPLLAYKKLSRLHAANGWAWLDAWVRHGRFRPEYVVGGVVSGRWASRGGRGTADPTPGPGRRARRPGAQAHRGRRVPAGAPCSRGPRAGFHHGRGRPGPGSLRGHRCQGLRRRPGQGEDGPAGCDVRRHLRRGRPPDAAAGQDLSARGGLRRTGGPDGEAGRTVTSRLGRSSPPPSERWFLSQRSTSAEEQRRADSIARSRGRFTRNFVVQGSAADWAACWLAELRRRLRTMRADGSATGELVFFLHDEVMVHAPDAAVDACIRAIEEAANAAKELLFGPIPVEFPVSVAVVDSYDNAK